MEILNLNLKKKWFDMTLARIKKEEYREITPFWIRRLVSISAPEEEKGENKTTPHNIVFDLKNHPADEVLKAYYSDFKKFDVTRFMNGMNPHAPVFTIEHKGIRIGEGNPEWGAEPGKKYFVISHGEILETRNIKH